MEKREPNRKYKILIVDDMDENLSALQRQLKEPDRLLFKATSGQEALEIMEKEDISIIILDIKCLKWMAGSCWENEIQ